MVVVLAWGCLWKTQHSWWGDAASTAISESAKQNSDLQQPGQQGGREGVLGRVILLKERGREGERELT